MFKDVSNTLQNFKFMGAMVFEIAGRSGRPPLVKDASTKRLGKGRVKEFSDVNQHLYEVKQCYKPGQEFIKRIKR